MDISYKVIGTEGRSGQLTSFDEIQYWGPIKIFSSHPLNAIYFVAPDPRTPIPKSPSEPQRPKAVFMRRAQNQEDRDDLGRLIHEQTRSNILYDGHLEVNTLGGVDHHFVPNHDNDFTKSKSFNDYIKELRSALPLRQFIKPDQIPSHQVRYEALEDDYINAGRVIVTVGNDRYIILLDGVNGRDISNLYQMIAEIVNRSELRREKLADTSILR